MPGSKKSSKKVSRKSSKKSSRRPKRTPPQGFKDFGEFVTHIVKKLNIKRPDAMRLAKVYKDNAKKANPNADSVEAIKQARKQFDSDGGKELSKIRKPSRSSKKGSKRASKKASKKASRQSTKQQDYLSTSDE